MNSQSVLMGSPPNGFSAPGALAYAPPPDKDPLTFWTYCPFCFHLYEYQRNYENAYMKCQNQNCYRPFVATVMHALPPLVPGMDAYYPFPIPFSPNQGYGMGYHPYGGGFAPNIDSNQNAGFQWRPPSPFTAPPPLPSSSTLTGKPNSASKAAHGTPVKVETSPRKNGNSAVEVESRRTLRSSASKGSGTKPKVESVTVKEENVKIGGRVTRSRSHAIGNEQVDTHVAVTPEPKKGPQKASPVQGNISGNATNLLAKKAKMEILKSISEQSKNDYFVNDGANATPDKDKKLHTLAGKDSLSRKSGSKSSKKGKNGSAYKAEDSVHDEDGEVFGVDDIVREVCNDIVFVEAPEEPLATSMAIDVPDSDFYNFDDDRSEDSFQEGQIWAIYDEEDGMPRIYARIERVVSRDPFSVQIVWLQSSTRTKRSCGVFKIGKPTTSNVLNLFSHKLFWEYSPSGGDIRIHPRKSEVWAIHTKKSTGSDFNEEIDDPSRYQIVEIVSDFTEEMGIQLATLSKVSGFKSLYQRVPAVSELTFGWVIAKKDLTKFSHQIPARKVGEEATGLLGECWELDPAAIPTCLLRLSGMTE